MKKVLLLGALLTITSNIWAADDLLPNAGVKERVILRDAKSFTTEVSTSTVRCSEIGYGAQELKINLAALDGWTLFDHTNSNFGDIGEPCMTAGRCKAPWGGDGFSIDDLIQNNPGAEAVTVARTVTELKIETRDENNQEVCQRSLREDLQTSIRGIKFHHSRSGLDQNFPIEVCRK